MNAVGAGLDGGIQNGARGTTELGAEIRSLDFEFLDRIQWGKNDVICPVQKVDSVRVVINAVEQVVVLRRRQTIGGKGARLRIASCIRLRRVHAGAQLCQKGKIASVERQIINRLTADCLTDR